LPLTYLRWFWFCHHCRFGHTGSYTVSGCHTNTEPPCRGWVYRCYTPRFVYCACCLPAAATLTVLLPACILLPAALPVACLRRVLIHTAMGSGFGYLADRVPFTHTRTLLCRVLALPLFHTPHGLPLGSAPLLTLTTFCNNKRFSLPVPSTYLALHRHFYRLTPAWTTAAVLIIRVGFPAPYRGCLALLHTRGAGSYRSARLDFG